MYKSNIITQAWVYLMITLAKHRTFMGKRVRHKNQLTILCFSDEVTSKPFKKEEVDKTPTD